LFCGPGVADRIPTLYRLSFDGSRAPPVFRPPSLRLSPVVATARAADQRNFFTSNIVVDRFLFLDHQQLPAEYYTRGVYEFGWTASDCDGPSLGEQCNPSGQQQPDGGGVPASTSPLRGRPYTAYKVTQHRSELMPGKSDESLFPIVVGGDARFPPMSTLIHHAGFLIGILRTPADFEVPNSSSRICVTELGVRRRRFLNASRAAAVGALGVGV